MARGGYAREEAGWLGGQGRQNITIQPPTELSGHETPTRVETEETELGGHTRLAPDGAPDKTGHGRTYRAHERHHKRPEGQSPWTGQDT